jgi:DNA-binding MarR family transcriptional regulator
MAGKRPGPNARGLQKNLNAPLAETRRNCYQLLLRGLTMLEQSARSSIRQMPPSIVLSEAPERIGLHVTMVQLAIYADLTPRLNALGLTSPSRMTALFHIRANPGCSQSELAEFTGLSRPSAVTMVDQLEKTGLVERRAGADARTNALYITEDGEEAVGRSAEQTRTNEELIFGGLCTEERSVLLALLKKVIGHVEETRNGSAPR